MVVMYQKFRYGAIEKEFDLSTTSLEVQFIYVDDVLEAFKIPSADGFEVNGRVLPYLRDDRGIAYHPKRIPCRPGCVIDLVAGPGSTVSSLSMMSESSSSLVTLIEPVDLLTIKEERSSTTVDPSEPLSATLPRRSTSQLKSEIKSLYESITLADQSGHRLDAKAMETLIAKHLAPPNANNDNITMQNIAQDVGLLVKDVTELKKNSRDMLDMQRQTLDRISLIQRKTEAILTQQLEIAEYPIPRLFIVLPEEPSEYDPGNWFRTRFRLYFICECGKHTEVTGNKDQHHLHLAKHEGYVIREPTKFFKKYGPFLLLMLELIKFGSGIAGHIVPALGNLKVVELVGSVRTSIETVTAKIDYSLECIDKELAKVDDSSPGDYMETNHSATLTQQNLSNYLNNVEGLEGVELRQLGSFLKTNSKDNLLGNLYRMTTTEGHVKWVCIDHYRTGYHEKQVQQLRDLVQHARGEFDEQQAKIVIVLPSSIVAAEFYNALSKAKGILELELTLAWECTTADLEALEKALKNTRVSILQLDIQQFRISRGSKLLSTSSQYEVVLRLRDLLHMKSIHLILSLSFIKIFTFQAKPPPPGRACNLTLELVNRGTSTLENGFEQLVKAMKASLTLTTLDFGYSKIGDYGARELSEALKTNSTLVTLNLNDNSIGDTGAQAISQAIKKNSTLKTLDLESNSLGDKGAGVLSEALKFNSTLTSLNLKENLIGTSGTEALSEALKLKSTLTVLNLSYNSIGKDGALVLSEALKTNTTLTTLVLRGTSLREDGAKAVSEMLKVNSTLITLGLGWNSIGDEGAQALSEALVLNSTLVNLNLRNNSIGDVGARAIFEALKINSTLMTLDLWRNSITEIGAQILSEALKTNSTLTTLNLWTNSIGDTGAQELAEALKTNSTLNSLDLGWNSIGEDGARALIDALGFNSTLITLDLGGNKYEEIVGRALLKANSACTVIIEK